MHSAIAVKHAANQGKTDAIADILPHWQHALDATIHYLHSNTLSGNPAPKYGPKKDQYPFTTQLTARHLTSTYNQARATYQSHIALLQTTIKQRITHSTLNNGEKTILHRINTWQAWNNTTLTLDWHRNPTTGELAIPTPGQRKKGIGIIHTPVPQHLLKLARHLRKHSTPKLPDLTHCRTLHMDSTIALREESNTNTFDQWLRISTLNKGKPSWIPLHENPYLNKVLATGGDTAKILGPIQLHISEEGEITPTLIVETPDATLREGDCPRYLDANFSDSLLSTEQGHLYGGVFVSWIKEMDEKIDARFYWLQERGLKSKKDKHYQGLIRRVRSYTKNEIGRIINKIIADENVTEIVSERLDFRSPGLSKRMNRLLSRMGRSVLREKLGRIEKSHGVRSTLFNPAYSSQQCSSCWYVDGRNRVGRRFSCRCCGRSLHADVNAPRVLEARRSSSLGGNTDPFEYKHRSVVRGLVVGVHASRCSVHAASPVNHVVGVSNSLLGGASTGHGVGDSLIDIP